MLGMLRPFLLLTLPISTAPDGRDPSPPPPTPPAATAPAQDPELIADPSLVDATMLMLGEIDARLTVPVAVGSRGPYNFIIDTGAERTVVSRELAASLGLAAGEPVTVTSMTTTTQVNTVIVPDLAIKSIGQLHTVIAPALEQRNLGAAGLLGIDTLRNHQVSIDFEKGTMTVRPSEKRKKSNKTERDVIVVSAKNQFGQLIVTDAYYGTTRIQVVLDTGSQVTMGNSALRKRVGKRMSKPQEIQLTSVTGDKALASYSSVPEIRVGDVGFGAMPIAFADVRPFERFGLSKRPALLLGMDALRSFRRVDIDFPNREVRFLMPRDAGRPSGRVKSPYLPGVESASPSRSY